jgi:hypothetical protein
MKPKTRNPLKRIALAVGSLMTLSATASCATPFTEDQPFDLSGFTSVDINFAMNVNIMRGDSFSVTATAAKGAAGSVLVSMDGSTLVIARKRDWRYLSKMTVNVTMPRLETLKVNGSSTAAVTGFSGGGLNIDMNGMSTLHWDGGAFAQASIGANGASKLEFSGFTAESAVIGLNGASKMTGAAGAAKAGVLDLDLNGASFLTLDVSGSVKGIIDGASHFKYGLKPELSGLVVKGASTSKPR